MSTSWTCVHELTASASCIGHVLGGTLTDTFWLTVTPHFRGEDRLMTFVDVVTDCLADEVVGDSIAV